MLTLAHLSFPLLSLLLTVTHHLLHIDFVVWQESLFYMVPAGAMESYRKSIESHLVQCEVNVPHLCNFSTCFLFLACKELIAFELRIRKVNAVK